jgi:hypothetical protein
MACILEAPEVVTAGSGPEHLQPPDMMALADTIDLRQMFHERGVHLES